MKPILLSTCLGLSLCAATAVIASGPPSAAALGSLATNAEYLKNFDMNTNLVVTNPATAELGRTSQVPQTQVPQKPVLIPPGQPDQTPNGTPQPPPEDTAAPQSPAPDTTPVPGSVTVAVTPITTPPVTITIVTNAAVVAAPEPAKPIIMPNGEVGLRLNFRGVPLESVLNYMSDAAGFIIRPKTDIRGKVDVFSAQPLSKTEAVKLLKQILNDNGYTVMQDGRTLTIFRSSEAISHPIPVISNNQPDTVPKNSTDIVTQIDPIRSLNAVQLVKTLETLKPSSMTMTADESANALVMTDTQENIHHMMEIVYALDTVTSSSATIRVFPLRYADSKSLASLLKDLFPSNDTQNQSGRGGGFGGGFGRLFGGGRGGGFGGGGGGDNSSETGNGHTPTAKVNAVSDDHSNSLIVTAPDSLINDIAELVKEVDTPVEDTTVVQVFHLNHSDPSEMADLLTTLFPGDNGTSSDATRSNPTFGGFGGRFFGGGFGGGGNTSAKSTESDRMKKLASVVAVADRRTSSLVVTASTNLMPQIENMITNLDARLDHIMTAHVIKLKYADPVDVQQNLQDLFTSSTSSSSSRSSSTSAQSNPLLNRQQTILQQQNSTTTSSFSGGAGSKPLGN